MYKTRIKEKWWFSQCGRTWLVCRKPSPNPSWTPLLWLYMQTLSQNSSPNTNDLYIHYMDKSTGTPPSLEEKKALPPLLQQFWSVWNDCTMSLVFDDEFFCSRSAFKVTPQKIGVFIFISYYFVLFCFKYEIRFVLNIVFNHFYFRFRYFSSSS